MATERKSMAERTKRITAPIVTATAGLCLAEELLTVILQEMRSPKPPTQELLLERLDKIKTVLTKSIDGEKAL